MKIRHLRAEEGGGGGGWNSWDICHQGQYPRNLPQLPKAMQSSPGFGLGRG